MKRFIISLALLSLAGFVFGQEKSTPLKDTKDKVSYSIGLNIGFNLKKQNVSINPDTFVLGLKDALAGKPQMTDEQVKETMTAFEKEMIDKQKAAGVKNGADGEKFLAENKKKSGIKTKMVTLRDGKTAELQYKVIKEGTGETPSSNDTVRVNYRGTLINGKEFDSTAKHGTEPSKLGVSHVIKGWTEALEMMKVGSKWEIFLPAALAYEDRPAGPDIGPGSTLIFEMELVGIEPPPPPAPPAQPAQPLTSDIIRVPSADELKKGEKIQVLKPEDVERMKKEQEEREKKEKEKKP